MLQLKIPPPVYALCFALAMWLLSRYLPIMKLIDAPHNTVGLGLIVLAAILDFFSLWLFLKKRTTPNPMKPEFTTGLVINGFYKVSRNPMYLGLLLMLCGFAIFLGDLCPFLVLPVFIWVITKMQIKPEEYYLEQKFGEEYLAYKKKVRRWL